MTAREHRLPFFVAHRAGNRIDSLKDAEAAGVDYIEADVWLYRGALEIRHEKTAGPLPVLWDRWSLARGWSARFGLVELVQVARPETLLMLDLKGWDSNISRAVKQTMATYAFGRAYAVTSQRWEVIDAFVDCPWVQRFYSAGNQRLIQALPRKLERTGPQPVSLHSRFVTPATMDMLKSRASVIVPWRVRDVSHARALLKLGVHGLNIDDLGITAEIATVDRPRSAHPGVA